MGQGQSFCWNCGRAVASPLDHHVACKHYPRQQPNPAAQFNAPPPPQGPSPEEEEEEPPLSKQRQVRTCFTVWVSVLCSLGTLGLILAIVFAAQIQNTIRPSDRNALGQVAAICAGIGAALVVPGIVLAITWCSMFCCCKKRWVCACCGRA